RRSAAAMGPDHQPMNRPRHNFRRQYVFDREFRSKLSGRVVQGIAFILDRYGRDILERNPVGLHVTVLLKGKDPKQIRFQGLLGDMVKDRKKSGLGMG